MGEINDVFRAAMRSAIRHAFDAGARAARNADIEYLRDNGDPFVVHRILAELSRQPLPDPPPGYDPNPPQGDST